MHDRKDAGAPEIVLPGSNRIVEQPTDIRILPAGERGDTRGDEGVDIAALNSCEIVAPSGALTMLTPFGSVMVIFSGRPASSIPPLTQIRSEGLMP